MFRTSRRAALGLTALATVASTIALAVPAQAAPLPAWPAAGRLPSGCDISSALLTPTINYFFTDPGQPTIPSVHIGSGSSNITVLPPAGAAMNVDVRAVENCSGVRQALAYVSHNGAYSGSDVLNPPAADAFGGTWSENLVALQGGVEGATRPDSGVGYYQMIIAGAARRYDSFTLDGDFKVVGTPVDSATASIFSVGPWSATRFYALRATTLSNALSATKLKKGKTVKATAQLKMATNAGYVADAGARVVVQTKVGKGKWVTNATLTANASGVVTYAFVLSATTQVRFVHNRVLSGNFTNGAVSAIKTVTRI